MLLKTEGACNAARLNVMEEAFVVLRDAAVLQTAARMATPAVQRAFTSCQRTFLLPWSVYTLTSARQLCLFTKAAFENLQLKADFYQAI